MSKESIFQKYYKKLAGEGLMKSFLLALTIALFVETLILLAFWFVGIKRYWLSAGISVGVFAALVPSLYFLFFRPDTKAIAKRLDSLGLEERLLTMNELQNDESYIAMRQREDAKQALAKIDPKNVKIVLSKTLLVLLIVSFVCVGSMTTVTALANNGVIPGGNDIIDDKFNPESYYTVRYVSRIYTQDMISVDIFDEDGVGGLIEGMDEQLIAKGENGEAVLAVADPDWAFAGWGDGYEEPYRTEESVFVDESVFEGSLVFKVDRQTFDGEFVDMVEAEFGEGATLAFDLEGGCNYLKTADGKIVIFVYAYFGQLGGDGEYEPGDGMNDNMGEEDAPQDGNPDQDDKKDQNPSDSKNDSDKKDEDGDPNVPSSSNKDNNNIIDGNTDYKTRLEEYMELAKQYEANGEKVPDYILDFIQRYYDLLN